MARKAVLGVIFKIGFACQMLSLPNLALAKTTELKPKSMVTADADAAVVELKAGNQRFLSGKVRKDGQAAADVERLAGGQAPNSIVLSCSDSRVPPETVFDQKLGEMFTVRSAGETLSPQAIGSIEYAIEKLGTHLVVVLGHTNCGAVKAAVETLDGAKLGSENLNKLVGDIHPRIRSTVKNGISSKDLRAESWANASETAKDLQNRSKLISEAVTSGRVRIVTALYNLASGVVEFQ